MQISKTQINHKNDIHTRIYNFVLRVIALTKVLNKSAHNQVIINQLLRSATSMGANDQEADGTESRKDFIAKYTIVKKEAKETNYWLQLIFDTNPHLQKRMIGLQNEGIELVKIVSSIIINAKKNI